MANLPRGAELIPNPYNQIPGFSINQHHFLPGFPQMAWPMAEWVLDQLYPSSSQQLSELSLQVIDTPESALVAIMVRIVILNSAFVAGGISSRHFMNCKCPYENNRFRFGKSLAGKNYAM